MNREATPWTTEAPATGIVPAWWQGSRNAYQPRTTQAAGGRVTKAAAAAPLARLMPHPTTQRVSGARESLWAELGLRAQWDTLRCWAVLRGGRTDRARDALPGSLTRMLSVLSLILQGSGNIFCSLTQRAHCNTPQSLVPVTVLDPRPHGHL